jgi:hypothetical protein
MHDRRVVFPVVRTTGAAMQQCDKHISAAVNQHATIEEAVLYVGAALRLYNDNLMQLELEMSQIPEMAVAAKN